MRFISSEMFRRKREGSSLYAIRMMVLMSIWFGIHFSFPPIIVHDTLHIHVFNELSCMLLDGVFSTGRYVFRFIQ